MFGAYQFVWLEAAMLSILGSGWPATGVTPSEFERQMGKNQC